ncbi:MAG TPA: PQQ-binding-like beta-propeller repeat protein [Candidatus Saccharimonadales bacterium]|nr:PQQ-binding-like beta-propeller repeat protein [Candidatus Saccharimonadales bacterium]
MFSKWRRAVLLVLCLVLPAAAEDWPQWRGPGRTAHVPSSSRMPAKLSAEPKVMWHTKIGEGLASPVVASGKVIYLDHQRGKEVVHAVSADTGNAMWEVPLDDAFKDSQGPVGPRCTPMVNEDFVYAQSCRGELQCLSLKVGKQIWRANYQKDFGSVFIGEKGQAQGASRHGYDGAPVIDGNKLFALAGGTNGAGIVCFDKRSGKVLWKSQNDAAAYAPPIVATLKGAKQLVAYTADSLLGVGLETGNLLWRIPLKTTFARHVTTPVVIGDSVYVASHEFGLVRARISEAGGKFRVDKEWTSKEAAFNFASPVAIGKCLYGVGPSKNLICVDGEKGRVNWSREGYFNTAAGKAWAALLVLKENLLMLTDGGQLLLLAPSPSEVQEIGRAQVCGANWCYPAYADGKLYLRDARELICVSLVE